MSASGKSRLFFSPSSLVSCPITRAYAKISDVAALCLHQQLESPVQLTPQDAECTQQVLGRAEAHALWASGWRLEASELNSHPQRLYRSREASSLNGTATTRQRTFVDQQPEAHPGTSPTSTNACTRPRRRPRMQRSPGARHSVPVSCAGTRGTNYAWEPSSVVHTARSPASM